MPDAIALKVELEIGPNLSYILANLVNKSNEASKRVEKQFYLATSLTELQPLCLGYDQPILTLGKILTVQHLKSAYHLYQFTFPEIMQY